MTGLRKRNTPFWLFWLALAFLGFMGVSSAQEGAVQEDILSLQEVLEYTYANNPSLQAARAELRATQELFPQALAGWRPTIGGETSITAADVEGSNFGGASGATTSKDIGVSLSQPLFRGGRTFAETAAARHTIQAQMESLRSVEQDILKEAATVYMNVVRDEALLSLSENNRDVIAKELEATQDRFDVGELTRTDVSQAAARLADAEAGVVTVRGNLNSSRALFFQIVGMAPSHLRHPLLSMALPANLDEVILQAENHSPAVGVAENIHRASEEDINDVLGELLPQVSLTSIWNRTFDPSPGLIDEQTSRSIGVSASIPLYQAGATRSRVRQAKHTANQRFIEILEVKRHARQIAVSSWEALQTAQAEIRSRRAQVDAAAIAQEGVRYESELGSRTVLDALDADQELLDAQVALVTAKRNEIVATFELLATIGALSPETLGFNGDKPDYDQKFEDLKWTFFDMDVDSVAKLH